MDLLAQAIAQMGLAPVEMGSTPPMLPDRVGLVGFPVWLWIANISPRTWGTNSATATGGGLSLTATATTTRVVWEMGNGDVVTCGGPGSVWTPAFGKEPSPTCGYLFTHDGRYAVQAISFWTVRWRGLAQAGMVQLALVSRGQMAIGEAQVIVTGH